MPPFPLVPSYGAIKLLRQLALAGSTVAAIGGFCGVAATTYETHRRVRIAEAIVENKRRIHASPQYRGGGATMALMVELAEKGEFDGKDSLPGKNLVCVDNRVVDLESLTEKKKVDTLRDSFVGKRKEGDIKPMRETKDEYQDVRWQAAAASLADEAEKQSENVPYTPLSTSQHQAPGDHISSLYDHTQSFLLPPRKDVDVPFRTGQVNTRESKQDQILMSLSDPEAPSSNVNLATQQDQNGANVERISFLKIKSDVSILSPKKEIGGLQGMSTELPSSNATTRDRYGHVVAMSRNKWSDFVSSTYGNMLHGIREGDSDSEKKIIQMLRLYDFESTWRHYLFLEERGLAKEELSPDTRQLLLFAAIKQKKHKFTKYVMRQMAELGELRDREYNLVLQAFESAGDVESMAWTFETYSPHYLLDQSLYYRSVKTLLTTKRIPLAQSLMRHILHQPVALQQLQYLAASFVSNLWVNTRDLPLLQSVFQDLVEWENGKLVQFKLYNSIIQACVEARNEVAARHYSQEMTSKFGLSPDIRTLLLLLEFPAKRGDWVTVKEKLRALQSELRSVDEGALVRGYTRLVNSYISQHKAPLVWDFLVETMDLLEVIPDQHLSNKFLACCARDGHLNLVVDWFNLALEKRWRLLFNTKTFAEMFDSYWRDTRITADHLCVLLQTCIKLVGKRMMSSDMIETVRQSLTWKYRHSAMGKSQWARPILDKLSLIESECTDTTKLNLIDWRRDPDRLWRSMISDMSRRDYRGAIGRYQEARAIGGLVKPGHLRIAVQCSIRLTGSTHEASRLIKDSQNVQGWQEATQEIFQHNLSTWESWQGVEEMRRLLQKHYEMLEELGVPIKHRLCIIAANRLVVTGKAHLAIDLLLWVHKSDWCQKVPLDIKAMTVFLRAYALNRNLGGIEWTINHVLDQNISIDHGFYFEVWTARRNLIWKNLTESQLDGLAPISEEVQRWAVSMDIWVRDVKLREKENTHEIYQRGLDMVKLAKAYGRIGVNVMQKRNAQEVLSDPSGDTTFDGIVYRSGIEIIQREKEMARKDLYMIKKARESLGRVTINIDYAPGIKPVPSDNLRHDLQRRSHAIDVLSRLEKTRPKKAIPWMVRKWWVPGKAVVHLRF